MPRTKWYIIITAEDGGQEMFGPWLDGEKAYEISEKCRKLSSRYTGDWSKSDFEVTVLNSQPWPGIRAFKELTE